MENYINTSHSYNATYSSHSYNASYEEWPSEYHITEGVLYFNIIFLAIVAIVTVIGNTIALHAFIVSSELKRNTYYFIASLSVSDLMIAVLSVPIWIFTISKRFNISPYLSLFHSGLDIFCGTLSIMSLAMIGIERFICIKYALRYYQIMTTRRVVYMIAFVIVYAATCTVVNYLTSVSEDTNQSVSLQSIIMIMAYVVPVAIKLFAYGNIYMEAKKQAKEISKLERFTSFDYNDISTSSVDLNDNDSTATKKYQHSNSRESWTTSPLVRRKHHTKCDMNDDESDDYYDEIMNEPSKGLLTGKIRGFLKLGHSCCVKLNQPDDRAIDCNKNEKDLVSHGKADVDHDSIEADCADDGSPHRKNTDTILKKTSNEEEHCLLELNKIQEKEKEKVDNNAEEREKDGGEENTENTHKEKSKSIHKWSSVVTRTIDNNEQKQKQKRYRSCSCPAVKLVRQSLDVTSFVNVKDNKTRKGSSSPFLRRFRASTKWSPSNSPSVIRKNQNKQKKHEQKVRRFKKELRAAKVVGLIMGTFLICWTPFMVNILLYTLGLSYGGMKSIMFSVALHYLNSAINPILYVLLNKVYRNAVMKAFNKVKNHFR